MLFFKEKVEECNVVCHLLHVYEITSSQLINMDKSGLTFSKYVGIDLASDLKATLGISRFLDNEPYLGLPMAFGKSWACEFHSIIERVRVKIQQ